MPGAVRNFLGRLIDKVALGDNYNAQTGQYSHLISGLAGRGASVAAGVVGGPLASMAVSRGIDAGMKGKLPWQGGRGWGQGGGAPQSNQLGFGSQGAGGSYSFYNQAGANPYSQLGSGHQFPQANPQSTFGPQQSIWSFQGDPYKPARQTRYAGSGGGGARGAGECVTVDSILPGHDRAGDVKAGDWVEVVDAKTLEHDIAKVSVSETAVQSCVLIRTANGVELECSESAPIANAEGEQVLSAALMGHKVPTVVGGKAIIDVVVEVRPLGEKLVQKITCENKFFLAGKVKGKYLLHHNVKQVERKDGPAIMNIRSPYLTGFNNLW